MIDCIEFQEMIFTAIASDFELGSKSDDSTRFFGSCYGFLNVLQVAIKIQCPLVQITGGYFQQPHLPKRNPKNENKNKKRNQQFTENYLKNKFKSKERRTDGGHKIRGGCFEFR